MRSEPMPSVIVIGGGAVGAALTYRLTVSGASVTLLDSGAIGGGTTSTTFSMTIAARKTPRAHFDLAVAGADEHRRLVEALGVAGGPLDWTHHVAAYEWATARHDRDVIANRMQRMSDWGYPTEWTDGAGLQAREPGLALGAGLIDEVAVYPHETWYNATMMARSVAQVAADAGAVLRTGQRVVAISHDATGVKVSTADGDAYRADKLVICAGPATQHVAAMAGTEVPVRRVPGLVVVSEPVPDGTLDGIVMLPQVNLRPAPGRRLLAHSYTSEADLPERLHDPSESKWAQQVVAHASELLPAFGWAGVAFARVGVRPIPADGMPIAGWLDDDARIYALVAHSGVNLAPVLSLLAAPEILHGATSSAALAPFRPDRASLFNPDASGMDESTREMSRIFADSRADNKKLR